MSAWVESDSMRQIRELMESAREAIASNHRQTEAVDAWVEATPEGLTPSELRDAARRFAALAEEAGPRRGLCRFGEGPRA